MRENIEGLVALVTGGGRSIGRGIATALVKSGVKVLIATRSADSGQAVVDELNGMGGRARLFAADLSTRDACEAAVNAAISEFGQLDILVHNSGIYPFTKFEALTDEEFDLTLRTNLYSMVWLCRAALPQLKKSANARIVAISSPVGNRSSLAGLSSYAASKAGLSGLARNLAVEFGPLGISVNLIEPGLTLDESDPRMDKQMRDRIVATIPMGREGFPKDIAAAVLFFVSPAASHVTGQSLCVDGGQHLPDTATFAMAPTL